MKALSTLSFSWVDFVIVTLLCVGLWRGKKRGISEELLDIVKWAVLVVTAGFLYEPGGRLLAQTSVFSLLSCYIFAYMVVALLVFSLFAVIRRSVGAKIVGSDAFGNSEYYLGMAAGVFRYACIIVVGLAFLNARYYSQEEINASAKYQQDNFGSSFFVTLPDLQQEVFTRSFTGKLAHDHLQVVLIRSTASDGKGLGNETDLGRRRERSVYEVLDKKR
jgi:uncharacterized membrane protein required for colicin V production